MYPPPTPPPTGPHRQTPPRTPLDALVIGAGQAGLAVGYHLASSGTAVPPGRRRTRDRAQLGDPMGLPAAVHPRRVLRPARHGVPRRARDLPGQGPGRRLPEGLRRPVRPPRHAQHPRPGPAPTPRCCARWR